jgi:hypothetical protein
MKLVRDLIKQNAMQALLEYKNTSALKQKTNPKYHHFFNELKSLIRLRNIIQANINKFITIKPDLTLPKLKLNFQLTFTI